MSLGFSTEKADIDSRAASALVAFRKALEEVQRIDAWLDGVTTPELESRGYTAGEVTVLKSAFNDVVTKNSTLTWSWITQITGLN